MDMKWIAALAWLTSVAGGLGCGTSPEFVDEPEVAPTPEPPKQSEDAPAPKGEGPPRVQAAPCGMSTRAVRAQARRGRFGGVEGFDSRTCPPAGGADH